MNVSGTSTPLNRGGPHQTRVVMKPKSFDAENFDSFSWITLKISTYLDDVLRWLAAKGPSWPQAQAKQFEITRVMIELKREDETERRVR